MKLENEKYPVSLNVHEALNTVSKIYSPTGLEEFLTEYLKSSGILENKPCNLLIRGEINKYINEYYEQYNDEGKKNVNQIKDFYKSKAKEKGITLSDDDALRHASYFYDVIFSSLEELMLCLIHLKSCKYSDGRPVVEFQSKMYIGDKTNNSYVQSGTGVINAGTLPFLLGEAPRLQDLIQKSCKSNKLNTALDELEMQSSKLMDKRFKAAEKLNTEKKLNIESVCKENGQNSISRKSISIKNITDNEVSLAFFDRLPESITKDGKRYEFERVDKGLLSNPTYKVSVSGEIKKGM